MLLCCAKIALRQLGKNSQNSVLRDSEGAIVSKLLKVGKRLKCSADAEARDLEKVSSSFGLSPSFGSLDATLESSVRLLCFPSRICRE